jgi:hypothetical protein
MLLLSVLLSACSNPWSGDTLVAGRIQDYPTEADWARAVPLDVEVWRGNVHLPPEIVSIDSETTHTSSAGCHHGPSVSDPVPARFMALASDSHLYLRVIWDDRTADEDTGYWEEEEEGWVARPGADDGFAILWGEPGSGTMRCQQSCHMMEVDVYDGGTQMRMGMRHDGGGVQDLWRWRASVTGPWSLADDMVVDAGGKRGDEGRVLSRENRREDGPGPAGLVGSKAPYYLSSLPAGRQAQVRAESSWRKGKWQVTFTRQLDTGDPDDVLFLPGGTVPFGISVFDNTWTEHHVAESGLKLVFADGRKANGPRGDDPYEPVDF